MTPGARKPFERPAYGYRLLPGREVEAMALAHVMKVLREEGPKRPDSIVRSLHLMGYLVFTGWPEGVSHRESIEETGLAILAELEARGLVREAGFKRLWQATDWKSSPADRARRGG